MEQGFHPCTLSGSLDTIPSVGLALIRSVSRAVIPAFIQARPMACLSSCLLEWLPDSFHAVRHSCLPFGTPSCVPVFLQSCAAAFLTAIGSGCLQTGLRD